MVEEPAEARQPTPLPLAALKQLRLKQWAKQVFLVPALVFSGEFLDPSAILRVLVAILSFSLLASAGYILNDYLDREADRQHPKKRFRPIASGDLPIPAAFALFAAARPEAEAITCAGGGFGVERLAYALLGLRDIHEVYPLPRPAEGRIAV